MKYFVTALLLLVGAKAANAQFTITGNDVLSQFGSAATATNYTADDTIGVRAIEELAGPGVTWNFTGHTYTPSTSTSSSTVMAYPGGAALADNPAFTSSTHVIVEPSTGPTTPTTYEFVTINDAGFWINGSSQDSAGVKSISATFTPGTQIMKFPMTYGTTWNSTSDVGVSNLPPGATFTLAVNTTVDGYGTLVLPSGSYPTLRAHQLQTSTIAFPPVFSQVTKTNTYNWYTQSGTSASITADSANAPYDMSYSVVETGDVAPLTIPNEPTLRISSNPASTAQTTLYYSLPQDGVSRVTLSDLSGRVVTTLHEGPAHAGQNAIEIDPTTLAPGTYFLHMSGPQTNATEKLSIVR
jgi:hypothetical protein